MVPAHFLKGKFGIRRLYGLVVTFFLLFIICIDLRPATTSLGPSSAQNFKALNCDAGCYAFGSHALRVLIDSRGVLRLVFFDSMALTAFTALPSLMVLALADYISAGMLASVYITAVIQAKTSAPKLQLPIKDIPRNTKCIIIGVNDYVESYSMRLNHSCGYVNYIDKGTALTEESNSKARIFAQEVERYGDLYDIMLLDRDAEIDAGMAIFSVPKWTMAIGQIPEAPQAIENVDGTENDKLHSRVLVSRLGDAPDFYEKIDKLKRWATSSQASSDSFISPSAEIFIESNPNALRKRCSDKYFNIGDCMRNRADSVLTIRWDALVAYAAYVVVLYAIYSWMQLHRVNDLSGLYVHTAVGTACMFFGALLIGAIGQSPERWEAWYSAGEGNLHVQNILLIVVISRGTWKACEAVYKRQEFHVVDTLDKLDL